jgi:predicted transcriptional regulator
MMGHDSRDREERRMNDQSRDRHDQGATVSEVARALGITEGAVRKRVERGKLDAEHTQDGRLVVYLDRATTATDTAHNRVRQSRDTDEAEERYTRGLEEQVAYLRAQLEHVRGQLEREQEVRTEERRRHDTVIAQLSRANEEQARTIRELEAPAKPPPGEPESPETVDEAPDSAGPRFATEGAQEGARRPFWRRVFGR